MLKDHQKIGRVNKTVEMDKSCFSKRKNNVDRVYLQQWVFMGIYWEDEQCFMCAVPDRMNNMLVSVIINECLN